MRFCKSIIILSLFILPGCALLMPPTPYTKELVEALATDDASACVRVSVKGGGVAAAIGPGVIPGGGYGDVGLTLGRSGSAENQVLIGADGSCQIRSKDKDFYNPQTPQTQTMQGVGTGAIMPTPGTATATPKESKAKDTTADAKAPSQ